MDKHGLPPGWVWTTLEKIICKINPGFPSGKHNKSNQGVPHLRPMNVASDGKIDLSEVKYVEVSGYDALQKGDVLFNNTNSPEWVGKTAYITQDTNWAYSNHMTRIRFFPDTIYSAWIAFYLHYLTKTGFFKMNCRHHVNQASINTSFLSTRVPLPLPPLPEQQRIVDEIEAQFTRLDAVVTALKRAQANLKRYRASVLKTACEGRLVPQDPGDEPAGQLLERILAERAKRNSVSARNRVSEPAYTEPTPPDTTGLPELPVGWVWASLEQCFIVQRGRFSIRPRNDPRFYSGKYPFVQIGDLPREGGNITQFSQTLNEKGLEISRMFKKGTILIAIVGATIANTGILTFDSCSPDSLVGIQADDDIRLKYAEMYLRSKKLEIRNASYASGGQPNINLQTLNPYPIPLPPLAEQQRIVEEVERRLSVMDEVEVTLEANLKRAERLRQAILKRAFEGKLVPQNPADEPAAVLLERIREAKAKAEAKGNRQMTLPGV
jgi:type I restriction enzyme S subunit